MCHLIAIDVTPDCRSRSAITQLRRVELPLSFGELQHQRGAQQCLGLSAGGGEILRRNRRRRLLNRKINGNRLRSGRARLPVGLASRRPGACGSPAMT